MLSANHGFYVGFPSRRKTRRCLNKADFRSTFGTSEWLSVYLQAGPTENLDKAFKGVELSVSRIQVVHTTYDDYWKKRGPVAAT